MPYYWVTNFSTGNLFKVVMTSYRHEEEDDTDYKPIFEELEKCE